MTGVRVVCICPAATETGFIQDVKKQLLSSEYEKAWQRDTANSVSQSSEHVAKAMIQILQKASSGSVWLVEKSQPPREISFPSL